MRKRGAFVRALLLGALVLVGLVGCSDTRPPATTEGLLVRYVANENVDNFAANAEVDLSVTAMGVRARIPVLLDMDVAGDAAHGTATVDLSSLNTRNYVMEAYIEQTDNSIDCYLGRKFKKRPTTWRKWTIDTTSSVDITTLTDLLSVSEFTTVAKDSDEQVAYELTVPSSLVLKTAFKIAKNPVEVAGMDEQGLIDAVGNDKVRVDFSKDCLLRSITVSELFNFKSEQTNDLQVKVGLDASAIFEGYGTIDPASVAVPDEVRESATPTDAPIDLTELLGPDSAFAGVIAE